MVSRFASFHISHFVFKKIAGTELRASILIPKALRPESGPYPLLAHFHGGGLVVGDRLFEPWFPLWLVQLAEAKGAIIATPDYRLIPEAKGVNIIDDVKDFWSWVHRSLPSEVATIAPTGTTVDLDRIAVTGESAGGYLSYQSAFLFPEARIKAVIAQYGTIDIDHPAYNAPPYTVPAKGSFVDKYIADLKPHAIRVSTIPPDRLDLFQAILTEGRHRDLIGNEDAVRLMVALSQAKNPPPIWVIQGDEDQIVVPVLADNFVQVMKEKHPNTPLHYTLEPGPHGFDTEITLEEHWVQDGCRFIDSFW